MPEKELKYFSFYWRKHSNVSKNYLQLRPELILEDALENASM
jgi:hypothetical protein